MPARRLSRLKCILFAILLPATSVVAQTPLTYTDGNRPLFRIDVPDFWSVRTGGARDLTAPGTTDARGVSRVIGLQPETEPRLWIGFVSPYGVANFEQATEYLQDIGPFLVEDAVVDRRKSRRIAGLPARSLAGHGRRDGKAVNFSAVIIDLPHGRMAVSVVVMEAGLNSSRLSEVNNIFASFQAME